MTAQINYTDEQTVQLVTAYQNGVTVEDLATAYQKSVRSIIAKLTREGVYQSKTKKAGQPRITKAAMVEAIAAMCDVDPQLLQSLEKASLEALQIVYNKIA